MTQPSARVQSAIQDAVATALPQLESVNPDAALTSDIGLDSVQVMDLVMEIEDRLDISVPVELLAEVETLNQLGVRLDELLAEQAR